MTGAIFVEVFIEWSRSNRQITRSIVVVQVRPPHESAVGKRCTPPTDRGKATVYEKHLSPTFDTGFLSGGGRGADQATLAIEACGRRHPHTSPAHTYMYT
ncbi:unnamed protein product [Pieris brassicae]|uniref:Uncharacterized protein n=1 Tax=Pieris brassicae TaxID=7116 RepID=A0A9P0TQS3_PIEBR|nr:unnamed protein product [Pieris brassicae]